MANTISVNVVADVKNISRGINNVNTQLGGFQKTASKVGSVLKGAFLLGAGAALGGGVIDFFKSAISDGRESNKVMAQTAAVIKSTGGAAGVSAAGVDKLASALSAKTGIDDEAIASGQNMLLTFTNIKNVGNNRMFDNATQSALDYSAATGTDVVSANKMLGKALNDPIKGLSALSKAGVSFTEQQKKQIKTMVDSGDTMGAQKIILGEFKKEFGGSAEAIATPMDKLKVAAGNIKEQIGQKLIPILDKMAQYIVTNLPSWMATGKQAFDTLKGGINAVLPTIKSIGTFIKENSDVLVPLAGAITTVVAAFKVWSAVTKAYTAVQAALNLVMSLNPIGLVIIAIAGLVAGLVIAYKKSETFRNIVNGAWNAIKTGAVAVFNFLKGFISGAFNFIKNAFLKYTPLGLVISHWKQIKSFVTGAVNGVKTAVSNAWNAVKTANSNAWNLVKSKISEVWNGIKSAVSNAINSVVGTVRNIKNRVTGIFSNAGSWLASAGRRVIQGFIDGIKNMFGNVKSTLSDLTSKLTSWKGPESLDKVILKNAGQLVIQGFINGIDSQTNNVKRSLNAVTDLVAATDMGVVGGGTVALSTSRNGSLRPAQGVNHYSITVNSLDPQTAERLVVEALNSYERKNGGRRV